MSIQGYFYFTEYGIFGMPKLEMLREFRAEGRRPFFVLDSCMCLEIVKLADYGSKAKVDKRELLGFLDLVKRSKGILFSIGGLIELSTDRKTQIVDRAKFYDLFQRIKMIDMLPIKVIRSFNFCFDKNYHALKGPDIPISINGLDEMLRPTYCCLLKIREIALVNGISKEKCRKNLQAFIDWMDGDLDIIMGVEFKLAVNIFGGETFFRRMINLDGNDANNTKLLHGTAWDICHYRMFASSDSLSKIVSEDSFPIFVTKDEPFYDLVKSTITENYAVGSNLMIDFKKPRFFDNKLTDLFNEKMLELANKRLDKEISYSEEKVLRIIKGLEEANARP